MWQVAEIADAVCAGLRHRAEALDAEQAVRGIDVLDELELHPVITAALEHAGFGVHREQRYPADRRKRRISEGERCDFVLTPDGRPLRSESAVRTLFEPPNAVELDDAFWLELKSVRQYTAEGPNAQYASQLLSTVGRDVTKLSKDAGILHAGLLIVLFVAGAEVARHDLGIWQDRCLKRSLPIAAPSLREFVLPDRVGHRACVTALYPVRSL